MVNKPVGEAYQVTLGQVRALMQSQQFDRVAIACDSKSNWRKEVDPNYKANREAPDKLMLGQLDEVIEQLGRDGCHVFKTEGFEADDIVAALVSWVQNHCDDFHDVTILSSDKDFAQLVYDAKGDQETSVTLHRGGHLYRRADVHKKWGVYPERFADFLALQGDASDNVAGVKGVGPKKAASLLKEFGDLAGISHAIVHQATKFTPALMTNLRESCDEEGNVAAGSAAVVALRTDAVEPANCASLLQEKEDTDEARPVNFDDGDQFEDDEEATAPFGVEHREDESPPVIDAELEAVAAQDSEPAAKKPNGAALVVRPVPFSRELEPRNTQEAFNLAKHIFHSKLFTAYGNQQAVFSTILMGRSLGLDAMTSLRGLHIIEGKPSLSAQLMAALVLRSGKANYFRCKESTDEQAIYETHRKGSTAQVMTFTISDAERAGLLRKDNWKKYPRTMLRHRAAAELARSEYPDVVGNVYVPGELDAQLALVEEGRGGA